MTPVLARLRVMADRHRIPHGLLFAGDESTAVSGAREFVRYLFCKAEEGAQKPCGTCPACRKLESGNHPDLMWVEPEKKEIKIDQARALQRWLWLAPNESETKFGVIAKADQLNPAASNALLKILEEPPAHALILLIAKGADGLLPTVRSRVQTVRFPLPSESAEPDAVSLEWKESLNKLRQGSKVNPADIFALTDKLGKDRDMLSSFFRCLEELLLDEIRSYPDTARARTLEKLFDRTFRAERATVHRYENVPLALEPILLDWLSQR